MTELGDFARYRGWNEFDGYLFDIDGTLIECADATHYFAFCKVLKMVSGRELTLAGVTTHGNTDVGILRDALCLAKIDERMWRARLPDMITSMGDFVERRQEEIRMTVLPRVPGILDYLRMRGARLAVATGNLKRIGTLKLKAAGLLDNFDFGGWSDAYEYRADVFRGAVELAHARWGKNINLCVVGDTPVDVQAAHENGLPIVAVATGVHSLDQLLWYKPEWCVESFAELLPGI